MNPPSRAAAEAVIAEPAQRIELSVGGMTCASCAARVEKRLNRIDGVTATVNYATEKATVTAERIDPTALVAAVEAAGYTATVPPSPGEPARSPADALAAGDAPADNGEPEDSSPDAALEARRRLLISAALSVPVIVLAMVPSAQFDYWQWASLVLAAPVVLWGGWPFHQAAAKNLWHAAATMDTLISLGT
ncbi:MAG TPA: cation transporter, partial [Sporichthyaceae bacterium]|nr:cation transporter [Sporichthyaceae bacterium]